jgi:hypothetical protein
VEGWVTAKYLTPPFNVDAVKMENPFREKWAVRQIDWGNRGVEIESVNFNNWTENDFDGDGENDLGFVVGAMVPENQDWEAYYFNQNFLAIGGLLVEIPGSSIGWFNLVGDSKKELVANRSSSGVDGGGNEIVVFGRLSSTEDFHELFSFQDMEAGVGGPVEFRSEASNMNWIEKSNNISGKLGITRSYHGLVGSPPLREVRVTCNEHYSVLPDGLHLEFSTLIDGHVVFATAFPLLASPKEEATGLGTVPAGADWKIVQTLKVSENKHWARLTNENQQGWVRLGMDFFGVTSKNSSPTHHSILDEIPFACVDSTGMAEK